jgi:hypothetical protein
MAREEKTEGERKRGLRRTIEKKGGRDKKKKLKGEKTIGNVSKL